MTIANPNAFAATADSIVILDPTPANLSLYVSHISGSSGGPVRFQNGATPSGLTYTFTSLASTTDDVDFSNNGGTTWTYVPTPNGARAPTRRQPNPNPPERRDGGQFELQPAVRLHHQLTGRGRFHG